VLEVTSQIKISDVEAFYLVSKEESLSFGPEVRILIYSSKKSTRPPPSPLLLNAFLLFFQSADQGEVVIIGKSALVEKARKLVAGYLKEFSSVKEELQNAVFELPPGSRSSLIGKGWFYLYKASTDCGGKAELAEIEDKAYVALTGYSFQIQKMKAFITARLTDAAQRYHENVDVSLFQEITGEEKEKILELAKDKTGKRRSRAKDKADEKEKGTKGRRTGEKGAEGKSTEEKGAEEKGAEEKGAEEKGAEEKGAEEKGAEEKSANGEGAEERAAEEKGAEPNGAEDSNSGSVKPANGDQAKEDGPQEEAPKEE